jgi:membrane protease YdiL (CAAX protease family)
MNRGEAGIRWSVQQCLIAGIGLVLAFGFVLRKVILRTPPASALEDAVNTIAVQWLILGIAAFIAFRGLRLRYSELGLRVPRPLDWPITLATLIIAIVVAGSVSGLFPVPDHAKAAGARLLGLPLATRILLVVTAGVCEEFLFRGFGIAVLSQLTGNRWLSGLLSLAAFTVAHAGLFGWNSALLIPCVLGLILTLLFLLRGNLFIGMIVHTLIDAVSLILLPMLAGKSP